MSSIDDDEELDPRIQDKLEELNNSTNVINQLEKQFEVCFHCLCLPNVQRFLCSILIVDFILIRSRMLIFVQHLMNHRHT